MHLDSSLEVRIYIFKIFSAEVQFEFYLIIIILSFNNIYSSSFCLRLSIIINRPIFRYWKDKHLFSSA